MEKRQRVKWRIPRIIVLCLLVLLTFFAFNEKAIAAVTGKIAGTVTDLETGEPLPLANCMIPGTEMGAACDTEGEYFILNVSPGTYSVSVRMMGYQSVTKTGVEVEADHTTPVDFELRSVAVEVPGITVVAKREIIKMDIAASRITSKIDEVEMVPLVTKIEDFVNLQTGLELDFGIQIRGQDKTATKVTVDNMPMVDRRVGDALLLPNLTAVKEVSVIKGGFNAEYGNVRSGHINVISMEGSSKKYNGIVHFSYIPPYQEHSGHDYFHPFNYHHRRFLDTLNNVWLEGTDNWPDTLQAQYGYFEGWQAAADEWNATYAEEAGDSVTPLQLRNRYIWWNRLHGTGSIPGADDIGVDMDAYREMYGRSSHQSEGGSHPHYLVDAGFGGPVPLINGLTFWLSHRRDYDPYPIPMVRTYWKEQNTQLNLSYKLTPNFKLKFMGIYDVIESLDRACFAGWAGYEESWGEDAGGHDEYINGHDILRRDHRLRHFLALYTNPDVQHPYDIYKNAIGLSIQHAISPSTWYELRAVRLYQRNYAPGWWDQDFFEKNCGWTDTTHFDYLGPLGLDEVPWGAYPNRTRPAPDKETPTWTSMQRNFNKTTIYDIAFDFTSQINKNHQLKFGASYTKNYFDVKYGSISLGQFPTLDIKWSTAEEWENFWYFRREYARAPEEGAIYVQDRIEFEGINATIGLRMDYFNATPDKPAYKADKYSELFNGTIETFKELAETKYAGARFKFSPRFGISHPIGEASKLFFNYGWFYSLPPYELFYMVHARPVRLVITDIGNPDLEIPKTVSYELGFEQEFLDQYLIRVTGYYKDTGEEWEDARYTNYDHSVDYETRESTQYSDIRGLEFELQKRIGRWITGWVNYEYRVTKSGHVGRSRYYEDPIEQWRYGLHNPDVFRAKPRPIFHLAVDLHTPVDWGPEVAGAKILAGWTLSSVYTWRHGGYLTWDPLDQDLVDNVAIKAYQNLDMRLTKRFSLLGFTNVEIFAEVHDVFNYYLLDEAGAAASSGGGDRRAYLESLHLPMYEEDIYQDAGYTPGNDAVGDVRSKDKPYINMPNIPFLREQDPRYIRFGIRVDF